MSMSHLGRSLTTPLKVCIDYSINVYHQYVSRSNVLLSIILTVQLEKDYK